MKGTATIRQANLQLKGKSGLTRITPNAADNLKKITADFGILQHEKINRLHGRSYHTLADNALALISSCKQYHISSDPNYIKYITRYLDYVELCQLPDGTFADIRTSARSNPSVKPISISDSQGHTIWALGYLLALHSVLPVEITSRADIMMQKAIQNIENIETPKSLALVIKGLYFYNTQANSIAVTSLIKTLADRLSQMFLTESTKEWQWFSSSISLGDSVLPEALLCAYLDTNEYIYKDIAKSSFDFLLLKTFSEFPSGHYKARIKSSRRTSDVVNMVLALSKFFGYFKENYYLSKISSAYSRFPILNNMRQCA
ncbi:MAG TPA: hypothetical protein VF581_08195 [Flavobacterium sp.]|jgi:hypothetical protein